MSRRRLVPNRDNVRFQQGHLYLPDAKNVIESLLNDAVAPQTSTGEPRIVVQDCRQRAQHSMKHYEAKQGMEVAEQQKIAMMAQALIS